MTDQEFSSSSSATAAVAADACAREVPPGSPIPWPGKQLTDIRDYNECCYRKCREQNPNGFYEDACGRACLCAVRARERHNGWNPCEHRLQPPVFWYEPYADPSPSSSYSDKGAVAVLLGIIYAILALMIITILYLVFRSS